MLGLASIVTCFGFVLRLHMAAGAMDTKLDEPLVGVTVLMTTLTVVCATALAVRVSRRRPQRPAKGAALRPAGAARAARKSPRPLTPVPPALCRCGGEDAVWHPRRPDCTHACTDHGRDACSAGLPICSVRWADAASSATATRRRGVSCATSVTRTT